MDGSRIRLDYEQHATGIDEDSTVEAEQTWYTLINNRYLDARGREALLEAVDGEPEPAAHFVNGNGNGDNENNNGNEAGAGVNVGVNNAGDNIGDAANFGVILNAAAHIEVGDAGGMAGGGHVAPPGGENAPPPANNAGGEFAGGGVEVDGAGGGPPAQQAPPGGEPAGAAEAIMAAGHMMALASILIFGGAGPVAQLPNHHIDNEEGQALPANIPDQEDAAGQVSANQIVPFVMEADPLQPPDGHAPVNQVAPPPPPSKESHEAPHLSEDVQSPRKRVSYCHWRKLFIGCPSRRRSYVYHIRSI